MGVPLLTIDEIIAKLDEVTQEDVNALAGELFAPRRMSAAGVGGDRDVFCDALEAVNPGLLSAA